MQERRKYVRAAGLVLVDYQGQKIEGKSSVFDVSGAGVRLNINRKIKDGSQVKMEMYLPGDSQPLQAKGDVIWAQEYKDKKTSSTFKAQKGYFYTGIAFTNIDENTKDKIVGFVRRKITKKES